MSTRPGMATVISRIEPEVRSAAAYVVVAVARYVHGTPAQASTAHSVQPVVIHSVIRRGIRRPAFRQCLNHVDIATKRREYGGTTSPSAARGSCAVPRAEHGMKGAA